MSEDKKETLEQEEEYKEEASEGESLTKSENSESEEDIILKLNDEISNLYCW